VSELLEEHIVHRSEELKERALRRRAAAIVARLVAGHRSRFAAEQAATTERAARARAAAHAASRLEEGTTAIAEGLAASLKAYADGWMRDLELVFVGRDRDAASRDPTLQRYQEDRAVAAMAPALARSLASLAPELGLSPAQLSPAARSIVRTAASSGVLSIDTLLGAIARSGVACVVETATAMSVDTAERAPSRGALRELDALSKNLVSTSQGT
jgi:hypothetical protein